MRPNRLADSIQAERVVVPRNRDGRATAAGGEQFAHFHQREQQFVLTAKNDDEIPGAQSPDHDSSTESVERRECVGSAVFEGGTLCNFIMRIARGDNPLVSF
jgi:hypothetical protein